MVVLAVAVRCLFCRCNNRTLVSINPDIKHFGAVDDFNVKGPSGFGLPVFRVDCLAVGLLPCSGNRLACEDFYRWRDYCITLYRFSGECRGPCAGKRQENDGDFDKFIYDDFSFKLRKYLRT